MLILALTAFALTNLVWATDPPERINYQGVLRSASDQPLDGSFAMTFRFFDDPTAGDEILVDTHAAVTVTGGLFNVQLGSGTVTDGTGPGTYTSLARVFGDYPELYLEVEVNGEDLSPRTRLASAGYALNSHYVEGWDLVSEGPLDLYVDGSPAGCGGSGCSDLNDGLSAETAKLTIQAAVNAIPVVITNDVTIHIADATYSEEVRIGRNVLICREGAFCSITLSGNTSNPGAVTLDGLESLQDGINAWGLFVVVSGMRVTNFTRDGVRAAERTTLLVEHCEIERNGRNGVHAFEADVFLDNVSISNHIGTTGISGFGVFLSRCYAQFEASIAITDNRLGLYCEAHCIAEFHSVPTMTGNAGGDMQARNFSVVQGYSNAALDCTASGVFAACQE